MPNQEVMREWVARLRSGKYEQGRGALNMGGKFCCLGVLCQMAADNGVIDPPTITRARVDFAFSYLGYDGKVVDTDPGQPFAMYDGATQMPSSTVYQWADITAGPVIIGIGSDVPLYARKLAELNDSGKTFAEIADVIEEHWIDLPEGTEIPDSPAAIQAAEEKENVSA